ncbi:MAG: acyl-CoA thioesterase [Alphaproteobacteria bacterium]|nr:acyl-CoA thioesterase [Alphaproteobacteria bacterium]
MTHPFRYYLRVRYLECDAQKVVFNARYGDYVDIGIVEYFRAMGLGHGILGGKIEVQLVKQTTQWRSPARCDEVLELSISTRRLGTTSFTTLTEFRRAGESTVFADVETIYVLVDPQSFTKMPIPAELRALLERGAPGAVIDHAGWLTAVSAHA